MYVLIYDISTSRRLKAVASLCEQYLIRVQNSVFEGELTKSQYHILLTELKRILKPEQDSVIIYFLPRASMKKKVELGKKQTDPYLVF
jgi:CRISPR-associated protein Cas2